MALHIGYLSALLIKLSVFDTSKGSSNILKSDFSVVLKLTVGNNCFKNICDVVQSICNFDNYRGCGILYVFCVSFIFFKFFEQSVNNYQRAVQKKFLLKHQPLRLTDVCWKYLSFKMMSISG